MQKILLLLLLSVLIISCTATKVAQKSLDEGDFSGTVLSCKNILAHDSTNADAYYLLGQAYTHLDYIDSALISYEKAHFYQPEDSVFTNVYYQTLIQRGDLYLPEAPDSAMTLFDTAIQTDPTKAKAVEKKSDLYFALEKYELARNGYNKALALGGDTLYVKTQLSKIDSLENVAEQYLKEGLAALDQEKYETAKKSFEKALDEKPDSKEARYQLYIATGLRLYQKGSINALWDALDAFARASFVFPDRGQPYYYMGLAYTKKDKDEYVNAIESFEQAIAVEPEGKWAEAAREEADRIRARKKKMDEFFGRD